MKGNNVCDTMTRYGRPYWLDQFPKSRIPSYPKHHGPLTTDVAIIGGGLTGCAAAYAFAAAGIKVLLFEAAAIGRGNTAASAGWIGDEPGIPFADLARTVGLRNARGAFQAWHRAALDFIALLRRLDIRCALEPRSSIAVAMGREQDARLRREQKARKDAGLEAPLLPGRTLRTEVGLQALGGLRGRAGATIDPYRAAVGLAAAAASRGAPLFERTAVTKVKFTRKWADLQTDGGPVRTNRVVVATGTPTALHHSLARHFWFQSSYVVLTDPIPFTVRRQLGQRAAVVRDLAVPEHVVRWVDDDKLLVAGADAESPPARQRDKVLVQRTGQLMYELSVLYPDISGIPPAAGWDCHYARTAEGLPYIGPHRNFPHHLFAFGDSSHGVTGAYLASRIMLRQHLGEAESSDRAFEFTR
jgi:glycine/D-amino acid oxidase-like deaminating enzyme